MKLCAQCELEGVLTEATHADFTFPNETGTDSVYIFTPPLCEPHWLKRKSFLDGVRAVLRQDR